MSRYVFEDLDTVARLPIINLMMHRPFVINSKDYDVPELVGFSADYGRFYVQRSLPNWPFLGNQIAVKRFLLMRVQISRALHMTFEMPPEIINVGDEQERLCMALRMTGTDDHRQETIAEFAQACELYAVKMLHGASGAASYTKWLDSLPRIADNIPSDLA